MDVDSGGGGCTVDSSTLMRREHVKPLQQQLAETATSRQAKGDDRSGHLLTVVRTACRQNVNVMSAGTSGKTH